MDIHAWIAIATLVVAMVLFISKLIPLEATALSIPVVLASHRDRQPGRGSTPRVRQQCGDRPGRDFCALGWPKRKRCRNVDGANARAIRWQKRAEFGSYDHGHHLRPVGDHVERCHRCGFSYRRFWCSHAEQRFAPLD